MIHGGVGLSILPSLILRTRILCHMFRRHCGLRPMDVAAGQTFVTGCDSIRGVQQQQTEQYSNPGTVCEQGWCDMILIQVQTRVCAVLLVEPRPAGLSRPNCSNAAHGCARCQDAASWAVASALDLGNIVVQKRFAATSVESPLLFWLPFQERLGADVSLKTKVD